MTKKKTSQWLSYVLRHKPENANIVLDDQGWTDIDTLVQNSNGLLTHAELLTIVQSDEKTRYTIQDNKVRANQGHSTSQVNLIFIEVVPNLKLYHGTTLAAYGEISKSGGLKPMNRHHVHLSRSLETASAVGSRRKSQLCILEVNAKKMNADGYKFYVSENAVYLTNEVPIEYITPLIKF